MLLEKIFRKENKIDKLVRENERIVVGRQRVKDKQNETNSNIETKIKALEDLAFRNKQKADTKIANLTRKLEKNVEQIDLEAKYYNKVAKATKGE